MRFIHFIRALNRKFRAHDPIIKLEISSSALRFNVDAMQKLAPKWQVAPVLKANAYGHGYQQVTSVLDEIAEIPFYCIDTYFEAVLIRAYGCKKPLLILGFTPTPTIKNSPLKNIGYTISSNEQLDELIKQDIDKPIQIKFDTGMHRQGIAYEQVEKVIKKISQSKLNCNGIFSHLAEAEVENSELTKKQITKWNEIVHLWKLSEIKTQYFHLSNSAGFGWDDQINANVGRFGISLYGINPGNLKCELKPALKMKSQVREVRTLQPGESIGYNATFTASIPSKVVTIPAGYFEGIDRRLTNKGFFKIKGQFAPIRGRVSMNMSSCEVSEINGVQEGDEVILISDNPADKNSIKNISTTCQTIPYEILVHLPAHLRRELIK